MPDTEWDSVEYKTVKDVLEGAGIVGTAVSFIEFVYEFGKTHPIVRA